MTTPTAPIPERVLPPPKCALMTPGRSQYLLAVLFLIGVCNMMDRMILGVLLEPIRIDLGASDTAMGLLTGFAFAVFYALASLPLARLADTVSRRNVLAVGLACWSAFTTFSGFVTSFVQLALARVFVGIGEATCVPTGLSMLSDTYPPQRRVVALSVFSVSMQIGIMSALILGGWLGETIGWRWTLVWMGVPGLVLALLVRFTVREPSRGAVEPVGTDTTLYDLRATLGFLWRLRSYRHLALGAALSVFAGSSLITWGPTFLMRTHEMGVAQAGRSLGPLAGIGGACGVLLGGFVAQRLLKRNTAWLLRVPMLANFLCVPFIVLFLLLPSPAVALTAYAVAAVLTSAMLGPAMTAVQALAKVRMRALASALVSLTVNLVGVGLGAFSVGAASDALRSAFGPLSLRYALMLAAVASLLSGVHFGLGTRHLRTELAREPAEGTPS